jgi:hypothetical protein
VPRGARIGGIQYRVVKKWIRHLSFSSIFLILIRRIMHTHPLGPPKN